MPIPRLLMLTLLLTVPGMASTAAEDEEARISDLGQGDRTHMIRQHERVDALTQRHLGRRLSGDKTRDVDTLQTLLDQHVVSADQTLELQAMGVVLGNLMAREHKLHWVIYEDRRGRSRALRLDESANFLFPVTMISRRVTVGLQVDVAELYELAIDRIRSEILNRYKPKPLIP